MRVPSHKEISRYSWGAMIGTLLSAIISFAGAILIMQGATIIIWVIPAGLAMACIEIYILSRLDPDDIPMEIAMYNGVKE